jgi:hypothetical protein
MSLMKDIQETVMNCVITIMSTNRKDKNAWGIPSMETYLASIMIREKIMQ